MNLHISTTFNKILLPIFSFSNNGDDPHNGDDPNGLFFFLNRKLLNLIFLGDGLIVWILKDLHFGKILYKLFRFFWIIQHQTTNKHNFEKKKGEKFRSGDLKTHI